jgi:hypothetical protein
MRAAPIALLLLVVAACAPVRGAAHPGSAIRA